MSNIMNFKKKNSATGSITTVGKKTANTATVKYTTAENLPKEEDKSTLIFTSDSKELYIGQGVGSPLAKLDLNSIVFADNKAALPTSGQSKEKLYVTKDDKVIYMYTDSGYTAISAGKIDIDPSAIKDLQTAVAGKADKADVNACRKTSDKITAADLAQEILDKLNSIPKAYDDTTLKSDVALLKANKADKTDLNNYRKTTDLIKEADLDPALVSKIGSGSGGTGTSYDDTAIKKSISDIQTKMATDEASYRKTTDAIKESDLDATLAAKIAAATGGGTVVNYDDTDIKKSIADIQAKQTADEAKISSVTTSVSDCRKITDVIKETDLDSDLQKKIDNAGGIYEYEADGSTDGECWVLATGKGVKITKGTTVPAAGGGTITYPLKSITIPDGVKVLSARIRFLCTEISASAPGLAIDWDATQSDNTDNNFVEPLCQVWNDTVGNRTMRNCAISNSVNNHTVTFTGIAAGGATGVGALVKLIY